MRLQYSIADVRVALESDHILTDSPSWQRFSDCSPAPVDFTYLCSLSPLLPKLSAAPGIRYYFDSVKGRYYAITQEQGEQMRIFLSEENLPWGQTVDQLFTQLAMTHVLLRKHKLLLHASYILTAEGAILFTAPSGTGKSTQAELWKKHRGALIVNGDRAVAGLQGQVPTAYGFPLSGSSRDCLNQTARLRAIVSLKQAPLNSVRRLRGGESVTVLMNGTGLPPEYPEDLPVTMDTAIMIAGAAPVLELSCLPEESAVIALENALGRIENGESE